MHDNDNDQEVIVPHSLGKVLSCGPFARVGKKTEPENQCAVRAPIYPSRDFEGSPEGRKALLEAQQKLESAVKSKLLPEGSTMEFLDGSDQIAAIAIPCANWAEAVSKGAEYKKDVLAITGAAEQQGMIIPRSM